MSELITLSASEMQAGLRKRSFSAVELVDAHLKRIEETNGVVNSFLTVAAVSARKEAAAADRLLANGGAPPLAGIPIAVKDMIVTKGIETTCASKMLKGFIPPYDGTAVERLRRQGAVIVGKTNMDEFAMGSSTENSAFGPSKNPWDLERVPGGSSGGSAVAVSLGQAPLSLGTDTGGSIRQPASFTGLLGLKPTYGRVSRYGVVGFASSLDQLGPFARTMPDLALILGVIAGLDPLDSTSMQVDVPDYLSELAKSAANSMKGLRVGVPKQYFIPGMDPEVEQAVKKCIASLEGLGAEVTEISLPHTDHALSAYYVIAPAEASSNLARYDGVRYGYREQGGATLQEMYEKTRARGFGAEVKRRILIGTYVLSAGYYDAYYRKAQEVRTLIINDFRAAFTNRCNLIATPVAPTTAFRLGENTGSSLQMYLRDIFTIPVNLAGLPGLSLPIGLDTKGLPIGLQLIAPPFNEAALLSAGQAILNAHPFDTAKMTRWKAGR